MTRVSRSLLTTAALAATTAVAFLFAPSAELRTEYLIDAPASAVWDQIARPEAQERWNPGVLSMTGPLTAGRRFAMTLDLGGGQSLRLSPLVVRREETAALCWRGRVMVPRLLDGEHCYLLIAEGDGTRLVNTEHFTGALLWFTDVESYRADFEAANAALAATLTFAPPV